MQAEFLRKDFFSVMICLPISSENTSDAVSNSSKPIGRIHLWAIEERHRHHRNTNIGISIASEYQGKGYGSEAIKWILIGLSRWRDCIVLGLVASRTTREP
jgi:RimJ/RimL family protein N-acetyltransferase